MLPRLQAEEDLRALAVVAAGTGVMAKTERQSYLRSLRLALGESGGQLTVGQLRSVGVRVREVPATGAAAVRAGGADAARTGAGGTA